MPTPTDSLMSKLGLWYF